MTIELQWCHRTQTYRVRGQWNPEQLMFFDDSVHDVELVALNVEDVRGAVVQVLRNFMPLLRLSRGRVERALDVKVEGPPPLR